LAPTTGRRDAAGGDGRAAAPVMTRRGDARMGMRPASTQTPGAEVPAGRSSTFMKIILRKVRHEVKKKNDIGKNMSDSTLPIYIMCTEFINIWIEYY
jgi:hypothetical protein